MDSLESLDDVLSGNEPAAVAPEPAPKVEPEPEPPKEEPKGEEAETTAAETPKNEDDGTWTKAAVLDERRKRQELEKELEALRQAQQPKEEEKRPDVFEDQEAAFSHLEQKFESKLLNERINLSRAMMEDLKQDYGEKEAVFVDMAKDNPDLIRQMQASPFPAKFAYEQASKHLEYKEMQDVDGYKERLKAEIRAELEAELKSNQDKRQAKENVVDMPSLSKTRSAKDNPVKDEALEDVFGR